MMKNIDSLVNTSIGIPRRAMIDQEIIDANVYLTTQFVVFIIGAVIASVTGMQYGCFPSWIIIGWGVAASLCVLCTPFGQLQVDEPLIRHQPHATIYRSLACVMHALLLIAMMVTSCSPLM